MAETKTPPPSKKHRRLPTETEQRLAAVDQRLEQCNASLDNYAARFKEAAQFMNSDAGDGVVNHEVDLEVDTSTAQHIEVLKAVTGR